MSHNQQAKSQDKGENEKETQNLHPSKGISRTFALGWCLYVRYIAPRLGRICTFPLLLPWTLSKTTMFLRASFWFVSSLSTSSRVFLFDALRSEHATTFVSLAQPISSLPCLPRSLTPTLKTLNWWWEQPHSGAAARVELRRREWSYGFSRRKEKKGWWTFLT